MKIILLRNLIGGRAGGRLIPRRSFFMKTKIKTGQLWISKQDGRILTIGHRNSGMKWNTTNSLCGRKIHSMTDQTIRKHYKLLDRGELNNAIRAIETNGNPFTIQRVVTVRVKPKPWFLWKTLYRKLVHMLLDFEDFTIDGYKKRFERK